ASMATWNGNGRTTQRRFGRIDAGRGGNREIGTRGGVRNASDREKRPLYPLGETIDDLLLAGLLERDRQLVAVDLHHVAVAEFLVKHAIVQREFRNGAGG